MNLKKTLLAASILAASSAASAIPITGGFEFTASAKQVDADGSADGIYDAIDFFDHTQSGDGILDSDSSIATVYPEITGTFATLFATEAAVPFVTFGSALAVKDISASAAAANNPLWSLTVSNAGLGLFGTVNFIATSASVVDGANPVDLVVKGSMLFEAASNCTYVDCEEFDATDATWYVSHTGQNTVAASTVSEPGTLALLGLGLTGLGFARRKQA